MTDRDDRLPPTFQRTKYYERAMSRPDRRDIRPDGVLAAKVNPTAATRAAERVPHLLLDTVVDISRLQGRRGSIYRGRPIGLPYGRAQAACRALQAAQHDCLVVRAGDGVALAQD